MSGAQRRTLYVRGNRLRKMQKITIKIKYMLPYVRSVEITTAESLGGTNAFVVFTPVELLPPARKRGRSANSSNSKDAMIKLISDEEKGKGCELCCDRFCVVPINPVKPQTLNHDP